MGSTTPASANCTNRRMSLRAWLTAVAAALLASACSSAQDGTGIQLDALNARGTASGVQIQAHQEIRLSREAREALRHGVPLRIRIDLTLSARAPETAGGSDSHSFSYEIRYLPMSDHYQLTGPDAEATSRTYPRLRHVLAALQNIDLQFTGLGREPGLYEIRMRSRLDRSAMPGPMQIPMLLSSDWDLDSGWVEQEFSVGS